ncbi:MAG TPA: hypothetical protein VI547_07005 [Anaerolineales bacterium]|nr:hypothetical protein [Anaerolineales bacterium]HLF01708.1 hypothetical protein [Anaerolineales bacterium]
MTTTAKTWFYTTPESNPYLINERVRTNFWDARFGGLWLDTVKADAPILMKGSYQEAAVELEWQPGQWCALRTNPASEALSLGVTNILGVRPAFKYEDPRGNTVWEWHIGDMHARWQSIQGKPEFGKLQRLK